MAKYCLFSWVPLLSTPVRIMSKVNSSILKTSNLSISILCYM